MLESLFQYSCRPWAATLLKKTLWHRCFSVSFPKFLRTLFLKTPLGDCFSSMSITDVRLADGGRGIFLDENVEEIF